VVHGTNVEHIFELFEVTSLSFVEPIHSALFDQLSDDFQGDLISPFVHEWHTEIVDKDSH